MLYLRGCTFLKYVSKFWNCAGKEIDKISIGSCNSTFVHFFDSMYVHYMLRWSKLRRCFQIVQSHCPSTFQPKVKSWGAFCLRMRSKWKNAPPSKIKPLLPIKSYFPATKRLTSWSLQREVLQFVSNYHKRGGIVLHIQQLQLGHQR